MTEFGVQQQMAAWFEEEGLTSDSPPVVAAQENAGNPHYMPTARRTRPIRADELVLLDLWGKKKDDPQAVYADITWVGFTGATRPARWPGRSRPFARRAMRRPHWCRSRPANRATCGDGRSIARRGAVLEQAGFGERILHRTGHNLGRDVHGNGVHMDDYESHDDGGFFPAPDLPSSQGCISTHSVCVRKSTCFTASARRSSRVPRRSEIVRLV